MAGKQQEVKLPNETDLIAVGILIAKYLNADWSNFAEAFALAEPEIRAYRDGTGGQKLSVS